MAMHLKAAGEVSPLDLGDRRTRRCTRPGGHVLFSRFTAPRARRTGLLGVRIDKYFLKDGKQDELFKAPVSVTVLNAGGGKHGAVIGGCSVYYTPEKVDGKWQIEFRGLRGS